MGNMCSVINDFGDGELSGSFKKTTKESSTTQGNH